MQKVIIQNLGPIKECEIDLKPFTVFIGESGTGKSAILKTVSLLKWIYKKMQYKVLLKHSKVKSDALRFRLKGLLENSMLDNFVTKDTYIDFLEDNTSLITIENNKLNPKYDNIKTDIFWVGKVVFLNDTRIAIPELLSSPSGKRVNMSYLTNDMIDSFYSIVKNKKDFKLSTMDISLLVKVKNWSDYFFIKRGDREIKFENSSSGEKNSAIVEAVCDYFAKEYDFADGFSRGLLSIISQRVEIKKIEEIQNFIKRNEFKNFLDILIEEPELNLFPTNQQKLAYYLSSLRNHKNKPNIILSTHSPYMLTAINNLILAYSLYNNKKTNKEEIEKLIPKKDMLNIDDLAVYEIGRGGAKNIINYELGIIDAESIDDVATNSAQILQSLCQIESELKK